ncbi:hypothetical protein ACLQ24_28235 [Micromonospora sp. DT4]|uniref:hypothetical protein n=1 Tax=Micromonospora sp. DT4 TaxID=3393438 RepID=UPI003CF351EC
MRTNEDRVGRRGTLAWVITGATDLYDDTVLPADGDVQWLFDRIGERLTQAGADAYRGSVVALLTLIADGVAHEQAALSFPASRVPPACSIAFCVDQGIGYDLARIGRRHGRDRRRSAAGAGRACRAAGIRLGTAGTWHVLSTRRAEPVQRPSSPPKVQ